MKKLIILTFSTMLCFITYAQISYKSEVYEANKYVPPVDLELLMKVNQYKQNELYSNPNQYYYTYDNVNYSLSYSNKESFFGDLKGYTNGLKYVKKRYNRRKLKGEIAYLYKVCKKYRMDTKGNINYVKYRLENLHNAFAQAIGNEKQRLDPVIFKK